MFKTKILIITLLVCAIVSGGFAREAKFDIPVLPELKGVHPKLLFSADQMATWQSQGRAENQKFIWDAAEGYFNGCGTKIPEGEPWNKGDGWQVWGWWWGTTNAFLYAKTGEERYSRTTIDLIMAMCASEHWELGGEQDYGMGAGNIMATVAIGYDVCYDLLSDEQRQIIQKRLLLAAKRFHDYGFYEIKQLESRAPRYWQNDPQNNHRWHRVCGYLLGTLAIYGEIDGVEPYLADAIKQAEFIIRWLPQDGTCHESVSYQCFGTSFLVPFTVALDRNTGSNHLETNRAFREFPHFRAHMVTPDRKHVWSFGDGGESTYYFSHYNFKLASAWGDKFMQAAHLANFAAVPGSYAYHGFSLIWHDPELAAGDLEAYPTWRFFPDMGIATFRSSWTDTGALAGFFKCGPYGGHRLNEYRDSRKPAQYVNVAHDHPDANSYLVSFKGDLLAQDFGTHDRVSSEHNTIMVNGKSQIGSHMDWSQPFENMGETAEVEQYFGSAGYSMVRGQAAKLYEDLSRYARTLLYVDDAYMFIADDIRSPKPAEVSWYFNSRNEIAATDDSAWRVLGRSGAVNVRMACSDGLTSEIVQGRRGRSIIATANDVTRTGMITFVAPQSDNQAELAAHNIDDKNIFARVNRGDKYDLIVVSSNMAVSRWGSLISDAESAVVTFMDNKIETVMIAGGKFLQYEDFKLSFSTEVCAKLNVKTGHLWVNAALGKKPSAATVEVYGSNISQINGSIIGPGADGESAFDLPTWQQLQDIQDGFTTLEVLKN